MTFLQRAGITEKKQRTRQRILEAAVSVFARKGFHATRIDEIVEESDTSKGAVYFHFPSKKQIFLAIVDEFADSLQLQLTDAIAQANDGVGRVDAALQVCLETFGQYRSLAKIFLVQAVGLGTAFEEKRLEVHDRFVKLIKGYLDQAVSEGDIPPVDTEVAAYAWMGAINEAVIHWVHTGQPEPERALPAVRALLLRSIGVSEQRILHLQPDGRDGAPVGAAPRALAAAMQQLPRNGRRAVVSHTVPWPNVSLTGFLKQAGAVPRVYWSSANSPMALAGYGVAAILTAAGQQRFEIIQRESDRFFEDMICTAGNHPQGIGPRFFGGFAFRAEAEPSGIWVAFPAACFLLPRYQLTRYKGQTWLTVNYRASPNDNPSEIESAVLQSIDVLGNLPTSMPDIGPGQQAELEHLLSWTDWQRLVTDATQRIRRGELDKIVLARASRVHSPDPTEPVGILGRLKRRYSGCYRFLFEPTSGHAFFGATPELLAEVDGQTLRAVALAGSIRRGSSPEEDEMLRHELLANPKERSEHLLVVNAIERNLQQLVTSLDVAPQPSIRRLNNIQHLQTVLQGELANGVGILPVVEALHPTPAVGGVPREVALHFIDDAEPVSRGWYAAPIGWIDQQGNGMFAVAIRSAVSAGDETMLFAGAGIVADSDPEQEWAEAELKCRPLQEALGAPGDA